MQGMSCAGDSGSSPYSGTGRSEADDQPSERLCAIRGRLDIRLRVISSLRDTSTLLATSLSTTYHGFRCLLSCLMPSPLRWPRGVIHQALCSPTIWPSTLTPIGLRRQVKAEEVAGIYVHVDKADTGGSLSSWR